MHTYRCMLSLRRVGGSAGRLVSFSQCDRSSSVSVLGSEPSPERSVTNSQFPRHSCSRFEGRPPEK